MTKKQIDAVVLFVLARRYGCEHDRFADCPRCLGRWIRQGIQKATEKKE